MAAKKNSAKDKAEKKNLPATTTSTNLPATRKGATAVTLRQHRALVAQEAKKLEAARQRLPDNLHEVLRKTEECLAASVSMYIIRMWVLGDYVHQVKSKPGQYGTNVVQLLKDSLPDEYTATIAKALRFRDFCNMLDINKKDDLQEKLLNLRTAGLGKPLTWPMIERLMVLNDPQEFWKIIKSILEEDWNLDQIVHAMQSARSRGRKGAGGRPRQVTVSGTGRILKFNKDVRVLEENSKLQWLNDTYGFEKVAMEYAADKVTPEIIAAFEQARERARALRVLGESSEARIESALNILHQKVATTAKASGVIDAETVDVKPQLALTHIPAPAQDAQEPVMDSVDD